MVETTMSERTPRKILLVEDDQTIRQMMVRRLTIRGFSVVDVGSGEEAVRATQREPPAVVVMDLRLPGMCGWDAARIIRADPSCVSIPILALTAHVSPEDRVRGQEVGCDSFFSKPVDFEALVKRLLELAGGQGEP
jgi:DNA-binding response OmpR family regulator